jgi:hypothetical protein
MRRNGELIPHSVVFDTIMSIIIHIIQVDDNGECATHVIPLDKICAIKCKYTAKVKTGDVTGRSAPKGKSSNSMDIFLSSGNKTSLCFNGHAVFRLLEDGVDFFKETSLKKFEDALLETLGGEEDLAPGHETIIV